MYWRGLCEEEVGRLMEIKWLDTFEGDRGYVVEPFEGVVLGCYKRWFFFGQWMLVVRLKNDRRDRLRVVPVSKVVWVGSV